MIITTINTDNEGGETTDNNIFPDVSNDNIKDALIALYEEKAKKAATIANMKAPYENKLKMDDFDGKPLEDYEVVNWISYVKNEKSLNQGRPGNIIYIFEKAITHIVKFWIG